MTDTLITIHLPINNGFATASGAKVSVDGYRLSWTAKLPRDEIQNIVDCTCQFCFTSTTFADIDTTALTHTIISTVRLFPCIRLHDINNVVQWEEHKDYALATTARLLNLVQTPSFIRSDTVLLEIPNPEKVSKEKIVSRLREYLPVTDAHGVAYQATKEFADALQSGGLSGLLLGYELPVGGIIA